MPTTNRGARDAKGSARARERTLSSMKSTVARMGAASAPNGVLRGDDRDGDLPADHRLRDAGPGLRARSSSTPHGARPTSSGARAAFGGYDAVLLLARGRAARYRGASLMELAITGLGVVSPIAIGGAEHRAALGSARCATRSPVPTRCCLSRSCRCAHRGGARLQAAQHLVTRACAISID